MSGEQFFVVTCWKARKGGAWDEIKFDRRHANDFKRAATVGDNVYESVTGILINRLTKAETWYLDAIQYEVSRDPRSSIEPPSLSLLSYDADHPEVPVIALWNTAPGCSARVFRQ